MRHLDSFHDARLTGPETAALFARRFGEDADGQPRRAVDLTGS